jgi:cyanophycinase-like exopeptidase
VIDVALSVLLAANCTPHVFPAAGTVTRTTAPLNGPGLVLAGGGSDIDAEFRWMHDTLSGGSHERVGNVIVLRAHDEEGGYTQYIEPLGPFQSVRTIGIPTCATREQLDALVPLVDGADAVFFAGGDQANYVAWKDSAMIAAVRRLWDRGGVVGGTSAGLAVQGDFVYDSVAADRLHPNDDNYAVTGLNATHDPLEPEISFTTGFFAWPPLKNVITDTHFARRDRFGRTVAFLARLENAQHLATGTLYALAVDERSALVVDKHGVATLLEYAGPGYQTHGAYLIRLVSVERLAAGEPLRATVRVLHLSKPGERVNLYTKRGNGIGYDVTIDGARTPPYEDPYYYPNNSTLNCPGRVLEAALWDFTVCVASRAQCLSRRWFSV